MDMISFSEACDIVMKSDIRLKDTEEINFTESLNRVLAGDVVSDMDMPPFNRSSAIRTVVLRRNRAGQTERSPNRPRHRRRFALPC